MQIVVDLRLVNWADWWCDDRWSIWKLFISLCMDWDPPACKVNVCECEAETWEILRISLLIRNWIWLLRVIY